MMKTSIVFTIVVACVLTAIFGCSRDVREEPVVSVGGATLTRAELDARAENIVALYAHKLGSKATAKSLRKIRATFCGGYAKFWVESTVLAQEAAKVGVEPSTNQIALCRSYAYKNFRAKGDSSYEDLMKLPGFNRGYWESQVRSEALVPAMKDYWAKKYPADIPESFADDMTRKILARNAEWSVSNRLQYAKATNVWHQLKAGADFVKTARANTELDDEIEDDCEWAVVDEKFLSDDPNLLKWLKAAKPGDFSPPIAADKGVMIARLDRFEDEGGFAVSRIFFHLAEILPPASKAEILATAERKHVESLYIRKLAELVKAANPVYSETKKQATTNRKGTK